MRLAAPLPEPAEAPGPMTHTPPMEPGDLRKSGSSRSAPR